MPAETVIKGMILPAIVMSALTITTATSVSAGDSIENRLDRLVSQNNPPVIKKVATQPLVEIAELRELIDHRKKWRLGLLLADKATHTESISNYFEMMSTAREIALELADIGMRDWLLSEIVARQISAGDLWSARANVLPIEHMGWKADALILIANAVPKGAIGSKEEAQRLNDWVAASDAAMQIQDEEWREEALLDLGIAPVSAASLR